MKFNVLVQRCQLGTCVPGIRHKTHKLCVGGSLFALCSVCVGALPELLAGSLVALSPEVCPVW